MLVLQGLQQLPDGLVQHGVLDVRGQVGERLQHEAPLVQEEVWDVQLVGTADHAVSVQENVEAPFLEQAHLPMDVVHDLAALKIRLAGLPDNAGSLRPSELSGGMRKRAGVARAIALDPDLLFLDEPTAGLDPIAANEFDELIRTLRDALGLTVFMITHDLDTLYTICDRVAVVADRKIVAVAPVAELEKSDHPWIKQYFRGPRGRAVQEKHR